MSVIQLKKRAFELAMHRQSPTVVTGRPGSGTTTLAHALARIIHYTVYFRDEFKEGFVNAADISHSELTNDANRDVYESFFGAIEFVISRGISLVAEATFQHELWAPKLEPLRRISNVAIVIGTVDPAIARARFIARGLADPARERFHGDGAVHAAKREIELPVASYVPQRLSVPTLSVDTTDGYDPSIEDVASFVM